MQVELLWLNCRIELTGANDAVDLEYYVAEEDSSVRGEVLLRSSSENHNHIGDLHPLVKQALLGCLREKNLLFLICGEEKGSPNWYAGCVEFLSSWHGAPKRRKLKAAPNPPPAPPNSKPAKSRDDKNSKKKSAAKDSKKKNTVGVPIIAAAAVTSILITLLCICCCCKCCRRSKKGLNDERPLLSLSSSDYSSHKSSALGSSFNTGNHSFNNNPNDDSKIEIRRTGPAGMPPLKPPPGRAVPSEAPAPPAPPPPAKTTTPAPAAPPPPPVKPSSVGPSPSTPGPPPPPPMKPGPRAPPRPPSTGLKPPRRSPLGPNASTSASTEEEDTDAKAKLKPFFWDKVQANTDQSMVWHHVKAGSFQ